MRPFVKEAPRGFFDKLARGKKRRFGGKRVGVRSLLAEGEEVGVSDEIGGAVEDDGGVDTVITDILGNGVTVVTQVNEMDFGEVGGEEGDQAVGVGVPQDQELGAVHVGVFDDPQGLVAAHKEGVLILDIQLVPVIEAARLGCAGEPGLHLHTWVGT